MERDISVVFHENDSRKSSLPQGFLSCVVTKLSDPQQTRRFIYCLHCTKLKSVAWRYRHKKKYNVVPSPEDVLYFKTNLFRYQQDIGTELDLLYDNGKLFVQQHEEPSHVVPSTLSSSRTIQGRSLSEEPPPSRLGVSGDDINDGGQAEENDREEDESINIKRTVDSICDCFIDFFHDSAFDLERFIVLSKIFFESEQHSTVADNSADKIKSKVITEFLIRMFVSSGMSKSQIDMMKKVVGAILVMVTPKNNQIARNVHAGYLSCRREAMKQHDERDLYVESCFEKCK